MALSQEETDYMLAHANDDLAPNIIAASVIGLSVSFIGAGLRLLARRKVRQSLQADDWWIIAALVVDVFFKAATFYILSIGFGRHAIFVTDPKGMSIGALINEVLWIYVTGPVKFSILCLYNRLFQSPALRRWSLFLALFIVAYSIADTVALCLQTFPFQAQWDSSIPAKWNMDMHLLIGTIACLDVLTDVLILASPVPQIFRLNLNRKQKRELFCVFGLGTIVIVFGVVRAYYTSTTPQNDLSYTDVRCQQWSLVEPSIGILSACLPCLRPLLPRRFGGLGSGSHSGSPSEAVRKDRSDGTWAYGNNSGGTARFSKRPGGMSDYEMFSHGKDGWTVAEEEASVETLQNPGQASGKRVASLGGGIKVKRDIEITYAINPEHTAQAQGQSNS